MNTNDQATKTNHTKKNPVTLHQPVEAQGDHPAGMGVLDGAAMGMGIVGGATSGMAVGLAAGPVGVAAGAVIGAVAGGLAGKQLVSFIDPTTDDQWRKNEFPKRPYVKQGQVFEEYAPFYLFGAKLEAANVGRSFSDIEPEAVTEYKKSGHFESTPWNDAKHAVADGYSRSSELRKNRTGHRNS